MEDTECTASRCPRCGSNFHCGMQDAAPCACTSVRLQPDTLAVLRERYTGCLCLACLHQVAGSVAGSAADSMADSMAGPLPAPPPAA